MKKTDVIQLGPDDTAVQAQAGLLEYPFPEPITGPCEILMAFDTDTLELTIIVYRDGEPAGA